MKKWIAVLIAVSIAFSLSGVWADDDKKEASQEEKKAEIDAMAKGALAELFEANASAKGLYDKAVGYAVFDNLKIQFIIAGGGGVGVAVDKASGERTYMKMGTGGIGLGLGGKKYQVIFLFETEKRLKSFIEKGWKADTSAAAAAGTAAAGVEAQFQDGLAYYQITESGLIASADIAGTKYFKHKKLNDEDDE
jgi:lipid-binding SYLF domain-containing protein